MYLFFYVFFFNLSMQALDQWRHPVASIEARDVLHWHRVMHITPHHPAGMASICLHFMSCSRQFCCWPQPQAKDHDMVNMK
jgi:hypothetical protein